MPTTRHGYSSSPYAARIWSTLEEAAENIRPALISTKPWVATVSDSDNPIGHGMEVLSHGRMPNGTPLSKDGRIFIAAVVLDSLKSEDT